MVSTDSNNLSVTEIRMLRERLLARGDARGVKVCDVALEGFSLKAAAKAGKLYRLDQKRRRLARGYQGGRVCRGIKDPPKYKQMVVALSDARTRAELDLLHRECITDLSYDRGDIKAAFGYVLRDKGWKR
jgi:hypothetical protein